jgi:aryl-alcohol dehydrogenase-like predicted oxidoreductase
MSFGVSKWAVRANISSHSSYLNLYQPWVLDEEPSIEIMKAAWDLGINTIDTANIYSNGESERLIAKFIKKVLEVSCVRWSLNGITVQHSSPPNRHRYKVLHARR